MEIKNVIKFIEELIKTFDNLCIKTHYFGNQLFLRHIPVYYVDPSHDIPNQKIRSLMDTIVRRVAYIETNLLRICVYILFYNNKCFNKFNTFYESICHTIN